MIIHGVEKIIINSNAEEYVLLVSSFFLILKTLIRSLSQTVHQRVINTNVRRGEDRTMELNSKYEGPNLEDFKYFMLDASVQVYQWEGEDFRGIFCPLFAFRVTKHAPIGWYYRKRP